MGLYTLLIIFLTNPSNITWNKSITNPNSQRFEPLWNFLWFAIGLIMGQVNTNFAFGKKQTQTRFFFPFLLIFWSFLRKERKDQKIKRKSLLVMMSVYPDMRVLTQSVTHFLQNFVLSLTLNTQTSRKGVKDLFLTPDISYGDVSSGVMILFQSVKKAV